MRSLFDEEVYSIEHVVPNRVLEELLSGRERYGAQCNPFNLMPAHVKLNQQRSSYPFDLQGDTPTKRLSLALSSTHKDLVGLDEDNEWVLPRRSRGDVSRCVLYMSILYRLPLSKKDASVYRDWARKDRPSNVEKYLQTWVHKNFSIRNPFIDKPDLLKEDGLFVDFC